MTNALSPSLYLLPIPRHLVMTEGSFPLADGRLILLDSAAPQDLRFAAARFQQALREQYGLTWELVASPATPPEQVGLTLRMTPAPVHRPQGYDLIITPAGITIIASEPVGVFYGVCTLIQILQTPNPNPQSAIRNPQSAIPCLRISDWPDFPARGVMLDVSRDRVPTLDTLLMLVDMLASWKVNQFQLYTEHTFAYRNHPVVWADASPLTGQDILTLDAYCRERHIELVPNQNSFGHMHRWLKHPQYAPLAEVSGDFDTPWGRHEGPFSLCPIDPGSLDLVRSLYDELLPHFTSRQINVGCDETFDLGQGRSKAECQRGAGRVYLDFLLKIYQEVKARGHTMQFWGDIIVQHPDLVPAVPPDAIALEWGYEADHPFDARGAQYAAAGVPFYVCPGTSSWCSLAGRTDNALGNLLNAAENGLQHGAIGYLNTDWGDYGHWQVLPVSFLGFAAGAAYSWALDANRSQDWPLVLSRHAFRDPTGTMGRLAYDLGNVYQAVGLVPHNSSALFRALLWPLDKVRSALAELPPVNLDHTLAAIDQAMSGLGQAQMARPDAALIVQEYENTARLMRHACRRIALAQGEPVDHQELDQDLGSIIEEYQRLWLARSRPGGLADSVARLERAREDYRKT